MTLINHNDPQTTLKLKGKDVKRTRDSLLEQQNFKCAICNQECSVDQAVLDHNHKHGHVRAVLHRTCNSVEGKILGAMRRFGIKDPKGYLLGLVKYHEAHETNQTGLIHPTFKTPEEKAEALKAKVKRKREALKKLKVPKITK